MTTLNTTDDLLRAARENREFREAFRREILTDDLVNLPQRVGDYNRETNDNIGALTENVNGLTGNVDGLAKSITEYNDSVDSRMEALQNATEANTKGIRDLVSGIDEIRKSHQLEHNAMHRFRGNYAIETTRNSDIAIAEKLTNALGINRFRVRSLPRDERDDLFDDNMETIDQLDTEGNISTSLSEGDIIAEVRHRRSSDIILHIAVEASYTVNSDDIIRASDNAKILRAATGHTAYAIVSGVTLDSRLTDAYKQRISYDLTQYIESEQDNLVLWFQLADRSLEPPPRARLVETSLAGITS